MYETVSLENLYAVIDLIGQTTASGGCCGDECWNNYRRFFTSYFPVEFATYIGWNLPLLLQENPKATVQEATSASPSMIVASFAIVLQFFAAHGIACATGSKFAAALAGFFQIGCWGVGHNFMVPFLSFINYKTFVQRRAAFSFVSLASIRSESWKVALCDGSGARSFFSWFSGNTCTITSSGHKPSSWLWSQFLW